MADPSSRGGTTRYDDPEIRAFTERIHASHDAALARAFDAPERHGMPAIQVSPSEGKLLTLLMRMLGARKVVEVGTLAGYSALRIARGLASDGMLWSLEIEPEYARLARENLAYGGVSERVELRVGAALELLDGLAAEGPFDAVFIDADKENYPDYARWAARSLRSGGLLLADNAYFFGRLLSDSAEAARMRDFHAFVASAFDSVCIPTPDGLVLALRK